MKGQEQVECKFYNELAKILVKDLPTASYVEAVPGESTEEDFPAYSHQEVGKLKPKICLLPHLCVLTTRSMMCCKFKICVNVLKMAIVFCQSQSIFGAFKERL